MLSEIALYLWPQADGTETNFFIGLVYVVANAFCLWSIIERPGSPNKSKQAFWRGELHARGHRRLLSWLPAGSS